MVVLLSWPLALSVVPVPGHIFLCWHFLLSAHHSLCVGPLEKVFRHISCGLLL